MTNAKLIKMQIENFKGIANGIFNFNEDKTEITADVMQGKTSVKEAFLFALGIDINGFFPCDKNNNIIDGIITKVEIVLCVDGLYYILSRGAKVKWKNNKETGEKLYDGIKQDICEFDGVPCGLSVYKEKICNLLCLPSFDYIKLLTIPNYFNESLTWKERRELIYSMFVDETLLESAKDKAEYSLIADELSKGKSTADISARLNSENNRLVDDKRRNEILIADKKAELLTFDSDTFLDDVSAILATVEEAITEEEKRLAKEQEEGEAEQISAKIKKLELELLTLENEDKERILPLNIRYSELLKKEKSIRFDGEILEKKLDALRSEYATESEKKFEAPDVICPLCKQPLKQAYTGELRASWEEVHESTLSLLKTQISTLNEQLRSLANELSRTISDLSACQQDIDNFQTNKERVTITQKLAELRDALIKALCGESQDFSNLDKLKEERKRLLEAIGRKEHYLLLKARLEELLEEQKDLANKEIILFKKRHQLEQYTLEVISLVNDSINSNFNGVKFKLFETLTATAKKDIKETLVCLSDGVDYMSQSTGQKAMTNCVIISTLQKKFGVNLPIWLDDASILNLSNEPNNQLIYLLNEKGRKLDCVHIKEVY